MFLFVVIVGRMVVVVVQVRFQMMKTKNLMRKTMMSSESFSVVWMVFLPRVLRVIVEPVEQPARLMIEMIVHRLQVGDHQSACGMHFVLRWVME